MSVQRRRTPAAGRRDRSARSLIDAVVRAREVELIGVLVLLVLGVTASSSRASSTAQTAQPPLNAAIFAMLAVGPDARR